MRGRARGCYDSHGVSFRRESGWRHATHLSSRTVARNARQDTGHRDETAKSRPETRRSKNEISNHSPTRVTAAGGPGPSHLPESIRERLADAQRLAALLQTHDDVIGGVAADRLDLLHVDDRRAVDLPE